MSFTIGAEAAQDITITTNLDTEPAHAEQLGHICVNWANLEWQMYLLFQLMSGSPPAIARGTFYAIDSTRGRREIISGIAGILLDKASDKSVLDDILRRVGRTSGQRNKYVHDTWGVASTQNHEIFQMRMSGLGETGTMEQIAVSDMKATADHIRKLAGELNDFRDRIYASIPALLEKYRKLPGLGLQYAPKGHPPGRKPKGFHGQQKS
jgi:hypothetical protein